MPLIRHKKSSMEIEILAQSKIIEQILSAYVDGENINIEVPDGIRRVILVASGSSYHCARYLADLFGKIGNIDARSIYSSEFLLKPVIECENDILYVFISQSGETTDTNSALSRAKELGVKNTLCITNNENSTLINAADYHIMCHAGVEKSIAATKSFTSQLICGILLVLQLSKKLGINITSYLRDLNDIPDIILQSYKLRPKIKQMARFLSKYKYIVVCADGESYALAKEASLKIKETSYINTCSYILGEFMHGHSAILNNSKCALIYVLNGELYYIAAKNLNSLKENYNPAICVLGNKTNQIKTAYNINIDCPKPIVKTFGLVVIIQLLALEIALKLHRNVDKPHGLNKVVK